MHETKEEWLRDTKPTPLHSLPVPFLMGSFRGELHTKCEGEQHQHVQRLLDFGVVLGGGGTAARGQLQGNTFVWQGAFASTTSTNEVRLATSVFFLGAQCNSGRQPSEYTTTTSNSTATYSSSGSSVARRLELRCKFVNNISKASQHKLPAVAGFWGQWFETTSHTTTNDDSESISPTQPCGEIVLWPTPAEERTGGLYLFEFDTPTCGLEHTGTQPYWHGVGAFVLRVFEISEAKGLRRGDVIQAVNGRPLPASLRSRDVSQIIREAPRPLRLLVWRNFDEGALIHSQRWQQRSNTADAAPISPMPRNLQSNSCIYSNANHHASASVTDGLREDILREIAKKKTSLKGAKVRRMQRDASQGETQITSQILTED